MAVLSKTLPSSLISSLTVVGGSHGLASRTWSNCFTSAGFRASGTVPEGGVLGFGVGVGVGCRTWSKAGLGGFLFSYSRIIFSSRSVEYWNYHN